MLNSVPFAIFVGILLGFLSGLGIGGGSLLILWLTLVLNVDANTARAINLMFFLTAAGCVCLLRLKKRAKRLTSLLPAMIFGCLFAFLASQVRDYINEELIQKLFGGLLLFIGAKELFYRPRNAK